jgi:hypothetical protein
MRRTLLLLLVALLIRAIPGQSGVLSTFSIDVRLKTPVSSQHSHPGDPVETVVTAPVMTHNRVLIPAGSVIHGNVEAVRQLNERHRQAGLLLQFTQIVTPEGETIAIDGKVTAVDNARETVNSDGWINGQRPYSVKPTKVQDLLILAAHAHPVTLVALEGVKFLRREAAHLQIQFAPGVDLTLTTPMAAMVEGAASDGLVKYSDRELDLAMENIVGNLPTRVVTSGTRRPADLTNIVLIGTRAEIQSAFLAAGWTTTAKLNLRSGVKTIFAAAEQHPYGRAPVSRLTLNARPPDLVFQKQNDTFAKRHHIRLWQESVTFDGRPIWVGAATHDIAIGFSYSYGFRHRIDAAIDVERAKVVDDLVFGGDAKFQGLLERQDAPRYGVNASGDPFQTDGRIAVLKISGWRTGVAAMDTGKTHP